MTTRKRAIPQASRRAVALAAGAVPGETTLAPCHYCGILAAITWPRLFDGRPGSWVHFGHEIDHVMPESHGGTNSPSNLVLACLPCNRSKGAGAAPRHKKAG